MARARSKSASLPVAAAMRILASINVRINVAPRSATPLCAGQPFPDRCPPNPGEDAHWQAFSAESLRVFCQRGSEPPSLWSVWLGCLSSSPYQPPEYPSTLPGTRVAGGEGGHQSRFPLARGPCFWYSSVPFPPCSPLVLSRHRRNLL